LKEEHRTVDVGFVQGGMGKVEPSSMTFGSADSAVVLEVLALQENVQAVRHKLTRLVPPSSFRPDASF
jgi:hypothetical protein